MTPPTDCSTATISAGREVGAPAGDGFHLVERAAGVAEAASGELRHRRAARGDERHEHERDLVADAAGRVLVDGRLAHAREVEPLPRRDHRRGPRRELAPSRPLNTIAIRSAAACSSATSPSVYAWRNQSICSSVSASPSRLARMTSMTWMARPRLYGQVFGAERAGEQRRHRDRARVGVDQQRGAAGFPQELAAAAARRERCTRRAVDARERDEPAAARRVQGRHQSALRAEREAVRRVLDVAAGDEPAVVDERGRADLEVRVRDVRALRDLPGRAPQLGPVDRAPVESLIATARTAARPRPAGSRGRPRPPRRRS